MIAPVPVHCFSITFFMQVVVDGESSSKVTVDSGVPQGTVLGPLIFLCHINDLPLAVSSQVRLFVDDCLLYMKIKSQKDRTILQNDLLELEKWATKWGMRFNAKKCYLMSIKNKSSNFYSLCDHILQQVNENPYLGITLTENLKWTSQITKTTKKANSTLAFLRRNLRSFPLECRKSAYTTLVRSLLDYGSIIWDPYLKQDIDKIECVQRQAARFITGDYKTREEGCVKRMLETLELSSLEQQRSINRLVFMYKVVERLVPTIPADDFLKPQKPKRQIRSRKYTDYISKNLVDRHSVNNDRCFVLETCKTDQLKQSFFVKKLWSNGIESILADSQHGFRSQRSCETQLVQLFHDLVSNLDRALNRYHRQTDVIIMDFAKAFDKVPHRRLLYTLDYYGIRGSTHKWITSWLSMRSQKVVLDGQASDPVPVLSGVPQGSVLGPVPFLVFIYLSISRY